MNAKKEDLDDCFHRLHDKYSSKAAIEPELELAFAFFGGAFMYHLDNIAENYGELGNLIGAITGGGGGGGGSSSAARAKREAPAAGQSTQQSARVITHLPSFQQQQSPGTHARY